jgi:hypothetical protein
MRSNPVRLALITLLLFLPGCEKVREVNKSVEDLLTVQKAVRQATGNDDVAISLNNDRYLDIGLVNSAWNSLPSAAKAIKAREVAGLAVAAYPKRDSLALVHVTYTSNRTYFLFVHYTNTTDNYAFDPATLEQARPGSPRS